MSGVLLLLCVVLVWVAVVSGDCLSAIRDLSRSYEVGYYQFQRRGDVSPFRGLGYFARDIWADLAQLTDPATNQNAL